MKAADVADMPIIAQGAAWTLYRDGARVMLVRFHGVIDDDASNAWRAAAQASFDKDGFPRVAFVAPSEGSAATTLVSRMKTAAFLRYTAQHVERVIIESNRETTFVIRTILRTAGAANVSLVDVDGSLAELKHIR